MKPLKDLLVISLEQAVAAPYCSSRLADSGARVIKIERKEGDFARSYDNVVNGESAYFVWLNRGKESICLNIKDKNDNQLLQNMIDKADVFIQNLSPKATSRVGLDSKSLRQRNPKLITVDISGYGSSGPFTEMKAYDLLVQCESGLASITGSSVEPGRVGVSVCDIACGMYAHTAILEALIERGITGKGKGIEVSLFDSVAEWMTVPLLHQEYGGIPPERVGLNHPSIAPYGAYNCGDNNQVVISIQNNREWTSFCKAVLKKPDLIDNCDFKDNVDRCKNRAKLDSQIEAVFLSLNHEVVIDRLQKGKVAFGSLNSISDFSQHPQLRRMSVNTPTGEARLVRPPVISTDNNNNVNTYGAVPAIGEHSNLIRREFSNNTK